MNRPGDLESHVLAVLVENKAGVLARVADLFARRGYNIVSLNVAPTDDERFSRITIVVDVEKAPLDQIVKQLFKLVNVVEIAEMRPDASLTRELIVVNVIVPPDRRAELLTRSPGAGGPAQGRRGQSRCGLPTGSKGRRHRSRSPTGCRRPQPSRSW